MWLVKVEPAPARTTGPRLMWSRTCLLTLLYSLTHSVEAHCRGTFGRGPNKKGVSDVLFFNCQKILLQRCIKWRECCTYIQYISEILFKDPVKDNYHWLLWQRVFEDLQPPYPFIGMTTKEEKTMLVLIKLPVMLFHTMLILCNNRHAD